MTADSTKGPMSNEEQENFVFVFDKTALRGDGATTPEMNAETAQKQVVLQDQFHLP